MPAAGGGWGAWLPVLDLVYSSLGPRGPPCHGPFPSQGHQGAHHSRPDSLLNRTWDSEKGGQASFGKFAILSAPYLPEQRGGSHKGLLLCFLLRLLLAEKQQHLPEEGCPRTGAAPGRALPGAMPRGRSDRPGPAPPLRLIESSGNHPSLAGLWAPIPRAQAGTNGGLSPPSPGQGSHMLLGPFSGPSFVHVSQSLHWGGGGLPHSCLASPLPWISTCPVKPQPTLRAGTARNGPRTVVCLRGPRSPSPSALGATWNVLLCSLDQSFCP